MSCSVAVDTECSVGCCWDGDGYSAGDTSCCWVVVSGGYTYDAWTDVCDVPHRRDGVVVQPWT